MTYTGSIIIKTEELGTHPATQFYQLRSTLGLSNNTLEFIQRWSVKCKECGLLFTPKKHAPKSNTFVCRTCQIKRFLARRRIYMREYMRNLRKETQAAIYYLS